MFQSDQADLSDIYVNQETKNIQAVAVDYLRNQWHIIDSAIEEDFTTMAHLDHGDPTIVSQTLDNSKWIIALSRDNGPLKYWMYDTTTKQIA